MSVPNMITRPANRINSVQTGAVTQAGGAQDQTGMEMRGRIDVDARTQTAYGTVQTVVQLRGANTDGVRTTPGTSNFLTAYAPVGNSSSSLTMERAYIRFAGFTAGVAEENLNTMPSYMYSSNVYPGFPNGIKQLVYTATFGGGFSATIGIESQEDFGYAKPSSATTAAALAPPSLVPTSAGSTYINHWDTGYVLVGNVRYDASWGFVQLAGLVGNDSAGCATSLGSFADRTGLLDHLQPAARADEIWRIRVHWIVRRETADDCARRRVPCPVWNYGHGFIGAVGSQGGFNDLSDASNKRVLGGVIRSDSNLVPTIVSSSGAVDAYGQTDAWGVYGIFTHYWTPNWRSNVAMGYLEIDPPTASCTVSATGAGSTAAGGLRYRVATGGLNTQWGEGKLFQVSGNLIWSPTKNFNIGVEAEYLSIRSVLQNPNAAFIAAGEPGLRESGMIYHLRLERQF